MFEDTSNWILGITFFGIVILGGIKLMINHVNNLYPPIQVRYFDRGTMTNAKGLRQKGDLIIKNGYIEMLLGKTTIKGTVSSLSFFLENGHKVYLAYLRRGLLFGLKDHISGEILETTKQPTFIIQDDGSLAATFSQDKKYLKSLKNKVNVSENYLLPVRVVESNASLEEIEIKTGEDIAKRFVQGIMDAKRTIDTNSPVMAIIIAWMPAAILMVLIGVVFWLAMSGLGNAATLITQSNEHTVQALNALADKLAK